MPNLRPNRRTLAFGLALSAAGLAARAQSPTPFGPAPLSPDDRALVARAADSLSAIGEARGRFVQTDARGQVSTGDIFIKRPGRARFAYDPPSAQLVVADGYNVAVSNPRLKTYNVYPLGATPLAILLSKNIRLSDTVMVTRVSRLGDGFEIAARDARKPRAGEIVLTFGGDPLRLREWMVTDAQGQSTRIRIASLEPTSGLSGDLFQVRGARRDLGVDDRP